MKLSQRTVDDLLTIIAHTKEDMSYGDEGSYYNIDKMNKNCDCPFDQKSAKSAERAIAFIKKLILERE